MKLLVLSVGGSCAPIVTSIKENDPDQVYFICSDDDRLSGNKGSYVTVIGKGKVCGSDWRNPDKPNIVSQLGLTKNQYQIIKIKYFDDHNYCYKECLDLLNTLKQQYDQASITIDYTGGTKSMTVGLVMAAADLEGISIAVVKGDRTNLVKVDDGTQRVSLIRTNYSFLEKQKQVAEHFISQFDYASAIAILRNLFKGTHDLPKDIDDDLQYIFTVSKAFDAWDKFEHLKAKKLLEIVRKDYWPNIEFLNQVIFGLDFIENETLISKRKFSGYELVQDLILNAERRAFQRRYDDAVGRIYRATELLAQIFLLKNFKIITKDVNIKLLPENLIEKYEGKRNKMTGRISLGLRESYNLIAQLDENFVGPFYSEVENKILSSLTVRNDSILAHGFTPVSEQNYDMVYSILVTEFIEKVFDRLIPNRRASSVIQFPQTLIKRHN